MRRLSALTSYLLVLADGRLGPGSGDLVSLVRQGSSGTVPSASTVGTPVGVIGSGPVEIDRCDLVGWRSPCSSHWVRDRPPRAPSRPQELSQMQHPEPVARRLFELTEPISMVNFSSPEPNDAMAALGFRNYWDGYFAGRSAPLGRVPAEVVHAAFYNFAEGEVARHIPKVWSTTTPEAAHAARAQGCTAALRRILGDLVETPELARAAELLARASTSAPTEGRGMYAGLRTPPGPQEPVARLLPAAHMPPGPPGGGPHPP